MNISPFLPTDQVFWYLNPGAITALSDDITTDVVIVGGGITGLSAAQAFHKRGLRVVLLEKNYCGSGASGKSSGFVTPNCELSLTALVKKYQTHTAQRLWEFARAGVHLIEQNIHEYDIACDYQKQDTLMLASTPHGFKNEIEPEHRTRQELGYQSTLYTAHELSAIIGSHRYYGGLVHGDSYGMQSYQYCKGMKDILKKQGVSIYEETPVMGVADKRVTTPRGSVTAPHIIICTDYAAASHPCLSTALYHAQTTLMLSAPLSCQIIEHLFPARRCLAWDTEMIYNYYRITGDNRLILGGARLGDTYATNERYHNTKTTNKLVNSFKKKFPALDITFEYRWPGLIGISKDLFPLVGRDQDIPSVYYATAATGIPWAAAIGTYSAQHLIDGITDLDEYMSPYRRFPVSSFVQQVVGTKISFALSNFMTMGSI